MINYLRQIFLQILILLIISGSVDLSLLIYQNQYQTSSGDTHKIDNINQFAILSVLQNIGKNQNEISSNHLKKLSQNDVELNYAEFLTRYFSKISRIVYSLETSICKYFTKLVIYPYHSFL